MSSKRAAPQSRSKSRSGGGIDSNKRREVGYRGGKRTLDAINPASADYLGQRTAFKKPPLVESTPNDFVAMGNTLAAACPQGPGGGRTVYERGTVSVHGKVSPGEGEGNRAKADSGPRQILGPQPNDTSPFHPKPFRRGEQQGE
jgi:hypothetical protein